MSEPIVYEQIDGDFQSMKDHKINFHSDPCECSETFRAAVLANDEIGYEGPDEFYMLKVFGKGGVVFTDGIGDSALSAAIEFKRFSNRIYIANQNGFILTMEFDESRKYMTMTEAGPNDHHERRWFAATPIVKPEEQVFFRI